MGSVDASKVCGRLELSALALGSRVTYANIVVSACSSQPALAVRLEMGGVDGGILVMPIDDKRSALHGDIRSS